MNSQDHPSHLNMADLPEDILREIFEWFFDASHRDQDIRHVDAPKASSDDFKTLQTLRLVCRSFCEVASPLLVPVLKVRLSPESLHRVDQLARNPSIAAGVRVVQVCTAYRPRGLALDPVAYRDMQVLTALGMEGMCDWYTEFVHEMAEDALKGDEDEIMEAMYAYSAMGCAWGTWPGGGGDGKEVTASTDSESDDGYRDILAESYDEYRRLQEEQERLLTDGSFVKSLAASISRMPGARALAFLDEADVSIYHFSGRSKLTVPANDHAQLRRLLTAPHSWKTLEELEPKPDILAVQLLWQLPIAIRSHAHSLGTAAARSPSTLAHFSISRVPILSNFSHLCPLPSPEGEGTNDNNDTTATWKTLASALSTLRIRPRERRQPRRPPQKAQGSGTPIPPDQLRLGPALQPEPPNHQYGPVRSETQHGGSKGQRQVAGVVQPHRRGFCRGGIAALRLLFFVVPSNVQVPNPKRAGPKRGSLHARRAGAVL